MCIFGDAYKVSGGSVYLVRDPYQGFSHFCRVSGVSAYVFAHFDRVVEVSAFVTCLPIFTGFLGSRCTLCPSLQVLFFFWGGGRGGGRFSLFSHGFFE